MTRHFYRSSITLSSPNGKRVADFLDDLGTKGISPGMRPHPVGEFLSLSPTMQLRILADEIPKGLILIYVDKHDAAYRWAERHTILRSNSSIASEFYEIMGRPQNQDNLTNTSKDSVVQKISYRLSEYGFPDSLCTLIRKFQDVAEISNSVWMLSPEWQEAVMTVLYETMAESR